MRDIIVAITILGNVILVGALIKNHWLLRTKWLVITSSLAIFADICFQYIHIIAHWLYAPARLVTIYWGFNILFALIAFEAFRWRMKWLEYLFLVQLSISLTALFAHGHGDKHTVDQLEWFTIWMNLAGIVFCIWKFKGELRYDPRP